MLNICSYYSNILFYNVLCNYLIIPIFYTDMFKIIEIVIYE